MRGGRSSYAGCSPHNRPKSFKLSPHKLKPTVPYNSSEPTGLIQLECIENNKSCYVVTAKNVDSTEPQGTLMRSSTDSLAHMEPHTPKMLTDLLSVERIMTEDDIPEGGDMSKVPVCCEDKLVGDDPNMFSSLLHLADHCLYAVVRWARSLPYFVNVPVSRDR